MADEKDAKEFHAACPQCGGAFVVDEQQLPARKIDLVKRNIQFPDAAARYAERAREKAEKFGVIRKCTTCGYRARFNVAEPAADEHADAEASGKPAKKAGATSRAA